MPRQFTSAANNLREKLSWRGIALFLSTTIILAGGSGQPASATTTGSYALIVAKVNFTNQTAPIPQTTIVKPKENRLYRVSYYMDCSGQNLAWSLIVYGSDANGTQQINSPICDNPPNPISGVMIVRVKAGLPLSYSVNGDSGTGQAFDVFFTVERLE